MIKTSKLVPLCSTQIWCWPCRLRYIFTWFHLQIWSCWIWTAMAAASSRWYQGLFGLVDESCRSSRDPHWRGNWQLGLQKNRRCMAMPFFQKGQLSDILCVSTSLWSCLVRANTEKPSVLWKLVPLLHLRAKVPTTGLVWSFRGNLLANRHLPIFSYIFPTFQVVSSHFGGTIGNFGNQTWITWQVPGSFSQLKKPPFGVGWISQLCHRINWRINPMINPLKPPIHHLLYQWIYH